MSYQVLARKYRPKSFATLVGQEHVVRALTHALDQQRLHHAYLFTGTRGVGKTTLSRILAKSFNCEKGITSQACGVCEACVAIDAGRFVDYIEMDAASNRGVDEMAQLLEQAIYAPSNARFKVYMIDEVHMLTNHAFNAMLKTLEEPPPHVKFILATTDPQKIPVTVLSRCLQFNLKQMPPGHIIGHLENILGQEQIEFEQPALRLLAQGAQGSMRDALSLTDQAIAYAAGKVSLDAVQGMLGALDQSYLIRLLDALAAKDGAALLDVADEMSSRSLSYKSALQDLGTLLHQIAVAQLVPSALADDVPERAEILRLAQLLSREDVQLFYQIAVHGRNELALAPDEYAGFSMCLLRMLAFRPAEGEPLALTGNTPSVKTKSMPAQAAVAAQQSTRVPAPPPAKVAGMSTAGTPSATGAASPSAAGKSGMSPAMAALAAARAGSNKAQAGGVSPAAAKTEAPPPPPVKPPVTVLAAVVQPRPQVGKVESQADNAPPPWDDESFSSVTEMPAALAQQFQDQWDQMEAAGEVRPAPEKPLASVAVAPKGAVTPPVPLEIRAVPELGWDGHWPNLAAGLPVRGVAQQLAQQSELVSCEIQHDVAVLKLRVPLETLLSAGSVEKLTVALSDHFQRKLRVETEIGAVAQTANAQAIAERAARQEQAEKAIQEDSFVQTLMREFGASIVTGSIKPI